MTVINFILCVMLGVFLGITLMAVLFMSRERDVPTLKDEQK